ncbi:hypothetical protein AB0F52_06400 [Amycolatopsis sp. NPDC024027]|uniref:hypothetical protein n=1 Tax=Amycolatopsis sp. NPDC024027 TaxID=3154327 RepID=UPI0033D83AC6
MVTWLGCLIHANVVVWWHSLVSILTIAASAVAAGALSIVDGVRLDATISAWIRRQVSGQGAPEVIAVDGKSVRGTFARTGGAASSNASTKSSPAPMIAGSPPRQGFSPSPAPAPTVPAGNAKPAPSTASPTSPAHTATPPASPPTYAATGTSRTGWSAPSPITTTPPASAPTAHHRPHHHRRSSREFPRSQVAAGVGRMLRREN